MNGDPKHLRIIGVLTMVPYLVYLGTQGAVPWPLLVPMPVFYLWRAWARRKGMAAFKPSMPVYELLPSKPLELDVIDVDYEVIE